MSKVLIVHKTNWADEIDLEGFSVIDLAAWENKKSKISKITNSINAYVGTNEDIEYENGKDFLETLSIKTLTDEEYNVISKFFGNKFGHFPIDDLCEMDEEDSDYGFFIDFEGNPQSWWSGMNLDIVDGPYKGKDAIVVGDGDNEHNDATTPASTMYIFVRGIPSTRVYKDPDDDRYDGDYVIINSNLIKRRVAATSVPKSSYLEYEKHVAELIK